MAPTATMRVGRSRDALLETDRSRGLLVDNGAREITMETMKRKTKVATVRMERVEGPGGGRAVRAARVAGAGSAAERSRQRGARRAQRGGREWDMDGRGRTVGLAAEEVKGSGWGGGSRCQGRGRRSLQTQAPGELCGSGCRH